MQKNFERKNKTRSRRMNECVQVVFFLHFQCCKDILEIKWCDLI